MRPFVRNLLIGLFLLLTTYIQNVDTMNFGMFTVKGTEPPIITAPLCEAGGKVSVMFRQLLVSKYLVPVAAVILILGILQILVGLFVFMSDALDIYMLLLNYCFATLFCIITLLVGGSEVFPVSQHTCEVLSPLHGIAISVPMMTLFLLSYSRFYAITYPFYYVDKFTVVNQLVVCLLSWLIPTAVVGLGSAFLCKSISLHMEESYAGMCLYPSKNITAFSYNVYNVTDDTFENIRADIPADPMCQIYMILYVLICLILPLGGCIFCYGIIVYQLTVIKKNREKITNSSVGPKDTGSAPMNPAEQLVPVAEESISVPEKVTMGRKKTLSVKSLKQHLKKQTSVISQKAKEKVPVSVILILTLYVLVAVPLTVVQIFNTSLIEAAGIPIDKILVFINLSAEKVKYLKEEQKNSPKFCDVGEPEFVVDAMGMLLDISYSLGLLALGLSPWAYIKFTKSFEENLWMRPLKRVSSKIGLEIQMSVRSKYTRPNNQSKQTPHSSGTTSGYSTGGNSRLSTVTGPGSGASRTTVSSGAGRVSTAVTPGAGRINPGGNTGGARLTTAVPARGARPVSPRPGGGGGLRPSAQANSQPSPTSNRPVSPTPARPVSPRPVSPNPAGADVDPATGKKRRRCKARPGNSTSEAQDIDAGADN